MENKTYKKYYKLIAPLFRFFFRVEVIGRENEPDKDTPVFVCSNHIALFDPILISASLNCRQVHYMAKKELFSVPILSSVIKAFGAYPVDRKNADAGAVKKTIDMLKNGENVGMFPQGTRCAGVDPSATKPKTGVGMICSRAQATLLPVFVRTKNYKVRPFRKIEIIIGKPIPYAELAPKEGDGSEYAAVSRNIFDAILALNKD